MALPARRSPHTLRTATLRTRQGGAIVRLSAHTGANVARFFGRYCRTWRYESFASYVGRRMGGAASMAAEGTEAADSTAAAEGAGRFGGSETILFVSDGLALWRIIETFVVSFLSTFYRSDESEGGSGGAGGGALPLVQDDDEVRAFWVHADTCALGQSLGLPPVAQLNFRRLADYVTHAIFQCAAAPIPTPPLRPSDPRAAILWRDCAHAAHARGPAPPHSVTAVHELLGNQLHNVTLPHLMNGRIISRSHFVPTREGGATSNSRVVTPQASVQDWYRNLCVTASTGNWPMPREAAGDPNPAAISSPPVTFPRA